MSTPMLDQYNELKQKYKDCILLFRLGDFYEGFNDDAKVLSKVLGLTLTGRGQDGNRTPMAGIPYHALHTYLPKLISAGKKVAIAEQLEEPKPGQIVRRDVTKIITAGTIIDENNLDSSSNNYLISIFKKSSKGINYWGLSFCDISTGEFKTCEYLIKTTSIPRELIIEIFRLRPSEVILQREIASEFKELFPNISIQTFEKNEYFENELKEYLLKELKLQSLKAIGLENFSAGITASAKLYEYIISNRKSQLPHINTLKEYFPFDYMNLDETTIRNLELIYPIRDGNESKTLYSVLNECATPMGQRKLRQWILRPLIKKEHIDKRLNLVSELVNNVDVFNIVNDKLNNISDFERAIARISGKSGNARDMLFIKNSLQSAVDIQNSIENNIVLNSILPSFDCMSTLQNEVINLIEKGIKEDPSILITEGDIIKEGFSIELDKLHQDYKFGKDFIKNLEIREIQRSGINSLKVRYNKVFGYYIEVSNSNKDKVPTDYIRKQTLVNGERYITEELKIWEEKVLGAGEKNNQMEYQVFNEIREKVLKNIPQIKEYVDFVSDLDCVYNFAKLAKEHSYKKPEITNDGDTRIINSRHPVVERMLVENFVPNDLEFNEESQQVIILTGPNMSGKSTYIRQAALVVLMAQIGSFVPASEARIAIVDRIFTRVGASDNLASGESTFMVEMLETANILNNATSKSLIILDEVGRGTSTFDGVAIAWAIVEYIVKNLNARTLFATHYHELLLIEKLYDNVKNFKVEVLEENDQVAFMHKINKGGIDKSYGIHVANLAGIPPKVISRSKEILKDLQKRSINKLLNENKIIDSMQISFGDTVSKIENKNDKEFEELKLKIKNIDINNNSPIDIVNKLNQIQKDLDND